MRKILAILIIAGLLVLALSVPALAGASDPPNLWGQTVKWATTQFPDPGYVWGDGPYRNLGGHMSSNAQYWQKEEGVPFGAIIQIIKDSLPLE